MSVKIRFKKPGKSANKKHKFRIIVCDVAKPRDGSFIEELGFYDPNKDPAEFIIDKERYAYWISKGAIASETIRSLVKRNK